LVSSGSTRINIPATVQETQAPAPPTSATRYAWFVLIVLVTVYGFNFADRYLFIIMMEPIKADLGLSDTQLGLISGLGFSLVYGLAGLGVARLADVGNRRSLLAWALAAWSGLTAVCGLAGNFVQLLLIRMGVGVAESGCSPPAHSLISDYFPAGRRGAAFSIYSVGLDLGMGLGFALGGWIGLHYGWRVAFMVIGLPGVLLAVFTRFAVREPQRGATDPGTVDTSRYSLREAASYMLGHTSFLAYILGSSLFVFAGTAIDSWAPLFLMRVHGLPSDQVGLWTGTLGSVAGFAGSLTAGWCSDRLTSRDLRWNLGVAMGGFALVIPATLGFLFGTVRMVPLFYFLGVYFNSFYMAPTIAITHALLPVRMRSLGSAVLLLGYNLIGTSGANFVIGRISDLWAASSGVDSVRYAMAMSLLAGAGGVACTTFAILRMPRDFKQV
jgi:predicted MFS family arabinose efflux permease